MEDEKTITERQQWYADTYLRSAHWRRIRDEKIEAAGCCCERCGEHGRRGLGFVLNLQVHHLTYERLWDEDLADLEVLCTVVCHEQEHGIAEDTEARRVQMRTEASVRIAGFTTGHVRDDIEIEIEAWDLLADEAGL